MANSLLKSFRVPQREVSNPHIPKLSTRERLMAYLQYTEEQPLDIQEVAQEIHISRSGTYSLLKELEDGGYIARRYTPQGVTFRVLNPAVPEGGRRGVPHKHVPRGTNRQIRSRYRKIETYLRENEGLPISSSMIAEKFGISTPCASEVLKRVIKNNQLEYAKTKAGRVFYFSNPNEAKVEPVQAEVAVEAQPEAVKAKPPVSNNEAVLAQAVDNLVWEFLKDTRSHDVLDFLKWMSEKS